jgi:predicted acyltransferase
VGLALNWFPFFNKHISDLRIFGVLQRIALAYGLGSLIVIFAKTKWIPWIFGALLVGYYAILLLGGSGDPLALETNAVRLLDLWLIGENHIYGGYGVSFDPEGLLSSIPAAGTVLFGYWVGRTIQAGKTIREKMVNLLPYGVGGLGLGIMWHFIGFPINKPLWSSSYVLVTGGLAVFFLIALLWILDEKGWRKWAHVFKAFGLNPLISYVLSGLFIKTFFLIQIGDQNLYGLFYTAIFQNICSMLGSFMQALVYALFIWLFAAWMYRKNIVIKL